MLLASFRRWWHHTSNTLATPLLAKASDAPIWRVFILLLKPLLPALSRTRYQKPPLTFDQQLLRFEQRGMIVADREQSMRWLKRVSYYRLSAYWYPFRVPNSEQFRTGTNFETVAQIYNFDRRFRLLIMDAIERVEVWLRTALTYEPSHHCGPFGYMRKGVFSRHFNHAEFIDKLKEEEQRSKETFVQHYKTKYAGENHLPIWMATELMSFGGLSHLYSAIHADLKRRIADEVGVNDTVFGGWMHSIGYVRNVCAHHSRLWNRQLAIKPRCPKRWVYGKIDNSRVYAIILVLDLILAKIAPNNTWANRVYSLLAEENQPINMATMGFPINWRERLPWTKFV